MQKDITTIVIALSVQTDLYAWLSEPNMYIAVSSSLDDSKVLFVPPPIQSHGLFKLI